MMLNLLCQFFAGPGRRNRRHTSPGQPACESLEDRRLLAAAGIETSVASLNLPESTATEFSVEWQPVGSGSADSVGMNLRIHYDSTALQFDSLDGVFQPGLSAQQETVESSDQDDGDEETDRVIKLLWLDLDGTWPGQPTGTSLVTVRFTAQPGFGSTIVNVDATSVSDTPLPRRQVMLTQDLRPVLTGPAAQNVVPRPEVTWTAVTGATSYDVWLSELSTHTNPYRRVSVTTNAWTPPTDLDVGRYQVWIQANFAGGVKSPWNVPRVFSVRTPPVITGPTGVVDSSTPVMTWQPVTGTVRYDVWINNATTGQSQIVRNQNISATEFTVPSLPIGTYLAWVRGFNSASYVGEWSVGTRYTVAPLPDLLTPLNPTFDSTPAFTWSLIAGAARYDLWVRNVSTGEDQVIRETNLTTTSFVPSAPLPAANYVWWVQAISSTGIASKWSRGTFSVGGRPQLLTPDGSTSDRTPTFEWTPVADAVRYDLWVNQIDGPEQIIRQTMLTTPEYTPLLQLPVGNYRFWVRAVSSSGVTSLWSDFKDFSVL